MGWGGATAAHCARGIYRQSGERGRAVPVCEMGAPRGAQVGGGPGAVRMGLPPVQRSPDRCCLPSTPRPSLVRRCHLLLLGVIPLYEFLGAGLRVKRSKEFVRIGERWGLRWGVRGG